MLNCRLLIYEVGLDHNFTPLRACWVRRPVTSNDQWSEFSLRKRSLPFLRHSRPEFYTDWRGLPLWERELLNVAKIIKIYKITREQCRRGHFTKQPSLADGAIPGHVIRLLENFCPVFHNCLSNLHIESCSSCSEEHFSPHPVGPSFFSNILRNSTGRFLFLGDICLILIWSREFLTMRK